MLVCCNVGTDVCYFCSACADGMFYTENCNHGVGLETKLWNCGSRDTSEVGEVGEGGEEGGERWIQIRYKETELC